MGVTLNYGYGYMDISSELETKINDIVNEIIFSWVTRSPSLFQH